MVRARFQQTCTEKVSGPGAGRVLPKPAMESLREPRLDDGLCHVSACLCAHCMCLCTWCRQETLVQEDEQLLRGFAHRGC